MTDKRHPAFTYPDDKTPGWVKEAMKPNDPTVPAHDPQADLADLVADLEADRDNWRRIAMLKDRQLVKLLNQVAELQAELKGYLGAVKKEADDHDRS